MTTGNATTGHIETAMKVSFKDNAH